MLYIHPSCVIDQGVKKSRNILSVCDRARLVCVLVSPSYCAFVYARHRSQHWFILFLALIRGVRSIQVQGIRWITKVQSGYHYNIIAINFIITHYINFSYIILSYIDCCYQHLDTHIIYKCNKLFTINTTIFHVLILVLLYSVIVLGLTTFKLLYLILFSFINMRFLNSVYTQQSCILSAS